MSVNEYLLVLAAILIISDFIIPTSIQHYIAYGLIVYVGISMLDIPVIYQVLLGIISYFALVVFHFLLWKKVIERFVDTFVARRKHIGGSEGMNGKIGVIKEVNGRLLFSIQEELHEFKTDDSVKAGDKCMVIDGNSTTFTIRKEE